MFRKLYFKLYFYIFISIISSISITSLYFYLKITYNQTNDLRGNGSKTSLLIRDEINKVKPFGNNAIHKRLHELNKHLDWTISYLENNKVVASTGKESFRIEQYNISELANSSEYIILSRTDDYLDLVIFLSPKDIKRDLLFISIKRRVVQNFISLEQIILISIIIGLLLIPFSIYLLSPYKKIIKSINSIAQGNFDNKLFVNKNNEFKELYDAFNNMSNRINEMIKQKQRLIADVSHELRSPLTRMRMSQEILIDNPNVDKDKYLNETIQEIEHLDKTITDLLILSKFELDQNELKLERTNLKDFLLELLEKNDLIFENHQIKLNLNLQDNIFCKIDYKLIESAFNNIFSNLIRYSPFNSYVDINLLLINNDISISIRDRGIGVKKSELEQIFEPFYRTDESRNSETGGTGLGLAILKKIIKAHAGKVNASLPIDQEGGLIINILLKPEK